MLDAALACYVRNGIAATSLRDIARRAEVTPALLHYYFGDKEKLRQAVVDERLLPVVAQLQMPLRAAKSSIAGVIEGFVRGIVELVRQHPWLPSLWVREVVSDGGALRGMMVEQIGPQLPQVLAARFAQAQADGELNAQLDPRLLVVSLVGLTMFPLAGAPIWKAVFKADELDLDALCKHTLALLQQGLELKP